MAERFAFGGKELQEGLGLEMYDFGARLQDPSLGRWFVVDALADQPEQIDKSPYAYGWNNPVYYTDPDGNCPWCIIMQALGDTQQFLQGVGRAVGEASDALMSRSWQGRGDAIRAEMANPSPPDDRTAFVQLAQPILDATVKPVVEGIAAGVQGDFEGVGYNGTKVAANVAVSRGIPGLKGTKGTKGAGGTTTTLYRAVDDFELSDISNKGLRVNPDGSGYQSGKLFAQSAEDAASQAKSQSRWDGTARTTLEVKVSNSVMRTSSEIPMDMGIMRYPTIEIPANQLSNINNILPLQSSAIPQIR